MWLKVKFEDPLTINVNVTITQKADERVAQLEKQQTEWLAKIANAVDKVEKVSERVDSKK